MQDKPEVYETEDIKIVRSPNYNLFYQRSIQQGFRCGRTREEDPDFSPFGPESVTIDTTALVPGGIYQHLKPQVFREILKAVKGPCLCWVTLISENQTSPYLKELVNILAENKISASILIQPERASEVEELKELSAIIEIDPDNKIECEECGAMLFSMHVGITGDIYPCQTSMSRVRRGPSAFDGNLEQLWYSEMAQSFRKARLEIKTEGCPIFPD